MTTSERVERNARIAEALRAHGSIVGAARSAGCDRGTVRRLIDKDAAVRQALLDGISQKEQERISIIENAIIALSATVEHDARSIKEARQNIVDRFRDMSHGEVKDAERDISESLAATSQHRRKLRDLRSHLRHARASCQFRHTPTLERA